MPALGTASGTIGRQLHVTQHTKEFSLMGKHRKTRAGVVLPGLSGRLALLTILPLLVVLTVVISALAITGPRDSARLAASDDTGTPTGRATADVAGSTVVDGVVTPAQDSPSASATSVAPQPVASPVQLAVRAPERVSTRIVPTPISFEIGTLNVLGSNHAPRGTYRAAREAALIRDRGIDIIGLQEVQRDQRPVFLRNMPGYAMWPQDALGRQGYRVQIMYRTDMFEKIDDGGVNHTFDSQRVPIPWIKLRDRKTGGTFYVVSSHNSPRGMQSQRVRSTYIQSQLVNRLKATGSPVMLVGDFNEHQQYFCRISSRTRMRSANGGYYSSGCVAPPRPIRIDWVLGTNRARFSGYRQDGATLAFGLSDHYLIYATATITVPVEVADPTPEPTPTPSLPVATTTASTEPSPTATNTTAPETLTPTP
jgi:endonuclease/exonuclease/phosphatase family metal-dependent hydrolase